MGQRFDHELVIGRAYHPFDAVYQDPVGTAFDLSDVTAVCQIRTEPGGRLLVTPTVTITDAEAGAWRITAPSSDTAALLPGRGVLEVTFDFDDGLGPRTVLEGTVTIVRGVVA